MPSTHESIPRLDMTGGLDSTTRPFLLPPDKWSVQHNMRTINSAIQNVAHKVVVGTCGVNEPLLALVSIPTGRKNNVIYVALTPSSVIQIRPDNPSQSVVLKSDLITDGTYRRWAWAVYNNQIWFTNELNPVFYTDGTSVGQYTTALPSAKYLVWFFDHCVVANDSFKGDIGISRVRWSDLYRPDNWVPAPENEADLYDVVEWCRNDLGLVGITGLGTIANLLVVYTPSTIVPIEYTGLPKVMRVGLPRVFTDVGNSLQWGLATYRDAHFFFDGNQGDFFMFDGEQVQSIGMPVIKYFADNLNTDYDLIQRTYAYVRPEKYEVIWRFVSKDSNAAHDRFVAYNWRNQKWHSGGAAAENEQSFGGFGRRTKTCGELNGSCDSLSGTCDGLGDTVTINARLWGSEAGRLLRESTANDATVSFIAQDLPTLETGDMVYGDIQTVKEVSSITIHASLVAETLGIKVSVAARSLLDDPVVFKDVGQTWLPSLPEGRLSLPRIAGRIFRYRFQPLDANVRDFTWSAFSENVWGGKAEK